MVEFNFDNESAYKWLCIYLHVHEFYMSQLIVSRYILSIEWVLHVGVTLHVYICKLPMCMYIHDHMNIVVAV